MAITQQSTLTGITFDPDGTIHAAFRLDFIDDGGAVVGQGMGPTMVSYAPGDDVSAADPAVQALATALWVPDVWTETFKTVQSQIAKMASVAVAAPAKAIAP